MAVIFGGKSAEHEVSLQSAKNVIDAIDKDKYVVVPIGITKKGEWVLGNATNLLLNASDPKLIKLNKSNENLALVPSTEKQIFQPINGHATGNNQIDVVFPVLHGTYGEDGTMQGLLKLLDVPFVGAGVLGSALGMDKDVMKRLLNAGGVPTAKILVFNVGENIKFESVEKKLGLPFFVKPANLGSSVGISKIKDKKDFAPAVKKAFEYDNKILIEEFVPGREVECSVLGNEEPQASLPGEVIPTHEFYSYEAKYIDERGANFEIPAKLPRGIIKKIQDMAITAFKVLNLEGMARVDFFLKDNDEVIVNEVNTIPGFTKISMYPKLWEASGLSYSELIDKLIELAIERHKKEKKLKTTFE